MCPLAGQAELRDRLALGAQIECQAVKNIQSQAFLRFLAGETIGPGCWLFGRLSRQQLPGAYFIVSPVRTYLSSGSFLGWLLFLLLVLFLFILGFFLFVCLFFILLTAFISHRVPPLCIVSC